MANQQLREFVHKTLDMGTPTSRRNQPGLGGNAVGIQGAISAGSDVLTTLKDQVIHFAAAYEDRATSPEAIKELANAVEGSILNSSVLSIISQKEADALIDQLHDITTARP